MKRYGLLSLLSVCLAGCGGGGNANYHAYSWAWRIVDSSDGVTPIPCDSILAAQVQLRFTHGNDTGDYTWDCAPTGSGTTGLQPDASYRVVAAVLDNAGADLQTKDVAVAGPSDLSLGTVSFVFTPVDRP